MPSVQQQQSINKLLTILEKFQAKAPGRTDDIKHLKQFFSSPEFFGLAKIKQSLLKYDDKCLRPVNQNASDIFHKVNDQLTAQSSPIIDELFKILNDPHVENMLSAHDMIAAKEYSPARAPPVVVDNTSPGSSMKNIEVAKGDEPLGATIKVDEKNSSIIVGRVIRGSIVDSSGLVKVGDELHEINGRCVDGLTLDEVADMVGSLRGNVKIKLYPSSNPNPEKVEIHLKANFSYDYRDDKEMPCSDLRMSFLKGDILRIFSKDDDWWQASKIGRNNNASPVGLIPGEDLQKRRKVKEITIAGNGKANKKNKRNKKKKDNVRVFEANQDPGQSIDDIITYEEVKLIAPIRDVLRPLVVVGPPKVGRNELKRVLIAVDPALFCTAIPHTTRPKEPSEVDGKDYYFVERRVMETQVRRNKFVEYGEFNGHLYGVSIDSIKKEAASGRVCIVDLRGESLKAARIPEIKPFVAYIKPPPIEKLRDTRATDKSKVDANTQVFTEADFREMLEIGQEYETLYGHMFDVVIVNDKLQDAVSMLQEAVNNMINRPQWVPASWVSS
ncbi:uncharacterized protein TRIADDRAFT_54413 [Trichoplax adhaerens]|uniref:MAGUK p55 subfamily member 7 n=1 Tax=Trichoplax adhaerens TaxID=10228 RepID=B3RRY8_TRIAD|nr:hypothetical protein TRIADDRAFT_54413 [Trichoplax adhaerens]EDV26430.1 hypothetical protein TRIADDRAFT_54413 [Trichoplax adhaerens]|eukprot:XP_002110426.1 hypothetical protein TRIADDRAFT_54413 [Trichoplax adhaerens]